MNEAFDFDNDNIDLDSDVSKIAEKYKLKERILNYYKKNIEPRKWNFLDLGVTVLEHIIKNLFNNKKVKTNSYRDISGGQISIDFTNFDNTRPYGGGLYDQFFFGSGNFYEIVDEFVEQLFDTDRHKREVHNESSRKFLERFLDNLSEPINEAFDFEDEEPDYDKDIKKNLNRLKLYRKFKRLLHTEVDAIGNQIVNYGGFVELFTTLMSYGFYIGYSTMNLTLGPDCDVKYYNYGKISPTKESFKLDIGIIELGKNSEAEVIQNLKDGLDKIVDLIEKRKDEAYDDYLDRCMSNIWITKFFRDKEKVNKLPYKFVDYINESFDFENASDLDDSVKDLADFHRRKERLVNELYKGYGRTLNKPEQDLPKVNGRMILPAIVRRFTNEEFKVYQSYINSIEYMLDDDNGNYIEFELPMNISLMQALKNMASAIYSSGNERLISRIEKNLERYLKEEYGS